MFRKLLIANRGEIAVRIARTAAEMGISTVAVHPADDAASLHVRRTDESVELPGRGAAAYLDIESVVAAAIATGCDAIHPGYGFLSENAAFARRVAAAGIAFIGPAAETLDLFGDKARARALAESCGVPVMAGTPGPATLDEARGFLEALGSDGAVMIKAVAGGGGRGMRPVTRLEELADAYALCQAEAERAFGRADVYVERLFPRARHIEVQIVGDGSGAIAHFWDRDCSIQRQRQKLVELAPAPGLDNAMRRRLVDAARVMAGAARYRNIGTFEFLVDAGGRPDFAFIEANPRLQVEHTVTELVTGVDLVRIQIEIAAGRGFADLGLSTDDPPPPAGLAMQVRLNMEAMAADGTARPAGGAIAIFEMPSGPGVRVDSFGYGGYRTSANFDSLLAKLIVHAPSGRMVDAANRMLRALAETRIAGVQTNLGYLEAILHRPEIAACRLHTRLVEDHAAELADVAATRRPRLHFETPAERTLAGAKVASDDPLAVLAHGKSESAAEPSSYAIERDGPPGAEPLRAPMQGTVIALKATAGRRIRVGEPVLVMEAMKMQHVVAATVGGLLMEITVAEGDTVFEGHPLAFVEPGSAEEQVAVGDTAIDLDHIRPDLAEAMERQRLTRDEARPEAVARRRRAGQRTARENIAALCDPGSFVEYGSLVIAARRQRNTIEELIRQTPADGMIMGIGRVNGDRFPDSAARCAVVAYDYTVLAGTQGKKNHDKKDRMFELIGQWKLPTVLFAEGGGGRPGDTDEVFAGALHTPAFQLFAKLSGSEPLVGVVSGRCFAGNAVLLGCCDVIIATRDSSIGMGGPAMIEGGGLGVFRPEEVGPIDVQTRNGVVDIAVADEVEAVAAARSYLSYFQGAVADWEVADQRLLRHLVPEDRLRVYDVRRVIETLCDRDSVLELRREFGRAMITALVRIEGRPMGLIANNPLHLGGAIDSDAADKTARFMQICDAFGLPILSLCDTPGNMVGPAAERTALVRHCCRPFLIGANLSVPLFTVVLRKAYGLGAMAMAGGSFHAPFFAVAWPTGEVGGMGLEGAVKLGYRNELAAIADPAERKRRFEEMVAAMYEKGKALSAAALFELDDVIDPAETRRRIVEGLRALPPPAPRGAGKRRSWIDAW